MEMNKFHMSECALLQSHPNKKTTFDVIFCCFSMRPHLFFFNFQIHAVWSFSRLNCTRNLPVTNTYIFVNKHGLWSDECSCTSLCGYPDKSGFWRFWFFNRLNIWVSLVFSPLNVHFVCYGLCVQERIGSHQFNLETLYGRNCEGDA